MTLRERLLRHRQEQDAFDEGDQRRDEGPAEQQVHDTQAGLTEVELVGPIPPMSSARIAAVVPRHSGVSRRWVSESRASLSNRASLST